VTSDDREWLETDGLGGYAMGTVALPRTRRYHALLCAARNPPTGRCVLVNGVDARVATGSGEVALSAHRYGSGGGDVVAPDGNRRITTFEPRPWPTWTFALPDGGAVEQSVFVPRGCAAVVLRWRRIAGSGPLRLSVRPLLSGRDHHALHLENPDCDLVSQRIGERILWRTYASMPAVVAIANGAFAHDPVWYRGFVYEEERVRGYDWREDLASPGEFTFDLEHGDAVLVLAADGIGAPTPAGSALAVADLLAATERRRRAAFRSDLHRAADQYLVRRGDGCSVIAGYPWFADWGRDTFLAVRGLCLATGRLKDAHAILRTWLPHLRGGMLPNRFPDDGGAPEYNSVDAALWFAIAAHELLQRTRRAPRLAAMRRAELERAILAIVTGYQEGTREGMHANGDGLLRAGRPGLQMTWMDAIAGDTVVTPRIGMPVELQALWINTLHAAAAIDGRWQALATKATASFRTRFWNAGRNCLLDVVDADHVPGADDASLRPNQILAVGGLPFPLLRGREARSVVDVVERELWTPLGLRTLAPGEAAFRARYRGDQLARDLAYHQGTAWPWLLGPFVEAWVAVRGGTERAKAVARARFLAPLRAHLAQAGCCHVSEVADGELPQAPGGAPFQAWSLGELLRLELDVLAPAARGGRASRESRPAPLGATA
jgi:predicted glycogen debranching enzyme